jgi:tryptophan synthase alpha chain
VANKLGQIRRHTRLPVGVGFGIKDAETAALVARVADAVVVGSALVKKVEQGQGRNETIIADIAGLLAQMRAAMDAATR